MAQHVHMLVFISNVWHDIRVTLHHPSKAPDLNSNELFLQTFHDICRRSCPLLCGELVDLIISLFGLIPSLYAPPIT